MTNEILKCIIVELGPTGLLVIGLYMILIKAAREIKAPLMVINHNTSTIAKLLDIFVQLKLDEIENGKNNRPNNPSRPTS